ncbi:MAG: methylmalonyl-CoA mutase family protein [Bacteroidales bacterium]|nr:methylmalonyl-CoA mutase family protein [Bacteroidales bacterium]
MEKQEKKLFADFQPVSTEAWEAQLQKDLKGADYAKKLIWKTNEGIDVKPYYRAEDLEPIAWLRSLPDMFPFVRGNKQKGNNWLVRQDLKVDNVKAANEKALDLLMKGVDALGFELGCHKTYTLEEIELLLKNIRADIAELNFFSTPMHVELVQMLEKLVTKYNRPLDKVQGSINYDPLARLLRRGIWHKNEKADFETAAALIKAAKNLPHLRVIGVNGHVFTNAGANIVQEMAFSLALGAEYLSRLTDLGLFVGDISPRLKFNLAVGSNYFMEIAKLRAYRLLWANITNAYGLNDANNGKMNMHLTNATYNLSLYDPYVNMLRTTTSSMSAILGGTDSLTVLPFDVPYETPTAFAERIARNQQLILKEESYFDKVADPAAGSYYIESLTDSLIKAAWDLFLEIQEKGGYLEAVKQGFIQEQIKEAAQKRDMQIASRREIILGTNQYPNAGEQIKQNLPADVFEADNRRSESAIVDTIATYRGAQAFEKMRYETDVYSRDNKRPLVWMLTYGNLAMRKARAGFASSFFASAGYAIQDNLGFDSIEEGIEAAKASKAEIVVLCSSDEEYEGNAQKAFEALSADQIVVLAGYPAAQMEALKAAGIQHFIHVKSNLLATLQGFQKALGIVNH